MFYMFDVAKGFEFNIFDRKLLKETNGHVLNLNQKD